MTVTAELARAGLTRRPAGSPRNPPPTRLTRMADASEGEERVE